jgi:signal transduction histidine kinase
VSGALWLAVALVYCAYFVATIVTGQEQQALRSTGLDAPWLAAYFTAQEVVRFAVFAGAAVVMRWRRPHDPAAWLTSLVMLIAGATIPSAGEALQLVSAGRIPSDFEGPLGSITVVVSLFLLFPGMRFVPRWSALALAGWMLWSLAQLLAPGAPFDTRTWPTEARFLVMSCWLAFGVLAQIYRYHFVAAPEQRQQTKLMVFGTVVGFLAGIGYAGVLQAWPALRASQTGFEWYAIVGSLVRTVVMLAMPLAVCVSVLHYRLWDIDRVIGLTLVYGMLTASVVAIYIGVVSGLGALLHMRGSPLIALGATGLVAVLFQPLRHQLQQLVGRLLYGARGDPYEVLTSLARRLEASIVPDTVLPTIVETVALALGLPYAALHVHSGDEMVQKAVFPPGWAGPPPERLDSISLHYQGEIVGVLRLAARQASVELSAADRRLVADLARQAGAAVHVARLTADLRASRERLVTASEEERRRLQRDLHAGIAPDLACYIGGLEEVIAEARTAPQAAAARLDGLIRHSQAMLATIRRIVYALRPPALDELGLLSAIREQAAQYEAQGLLADLRLPARLPPLSAASEVAAYRIVQETLVSLGRCGAGAAMTIVLDLLGSGLYRTLSIEIASSAPGAPGGTCYAGEQIALIRDWAEEVGGACVVAASPPRGTLLSIFLPAAEPEPARYREAPAAQP